jgi:hypothetical protein
MKINFGEIFLPIKFLSLSLRGGIIMSPSFRKNKKGLSVEEIIGFYFCRFVDAIELSVKIRVKYNTVPKSFTVPP